MKKIALYPFFIACLIATACKKDDNTPPNYVESLKGTTWGGTFHDKGLTTSRPYTMVLNADNSFDWQDDVNRFNGTWKVQGSILLFAFTSGIKNEWLNEINGNRMTIINQPKPDNFEFNNDCVKKP